MRWIAAAAMVVVGVGCGVPPKGAVDEVYIAGGSSSIGHEPLGLAPSCSESTAACEPPACLFRGNACNAFAPAHVVTLAPYFIDKFEVSNGKYRTCVEAGANSIAPPRQV